MKDDTISRQAALDALMKRDKALRNINWYDKPYAEGECKGIDEALDIINALPSAESELEDKIRAIGYTGKEGRIYIGGRLFAVRELPQ